MRHQADGHMRLPVGRCNNEDVIDSGIDASPSPRKFLMAWMARMAWEAGQRVRHVNLRISFEVSLGISFEVSSRVCYKPIEAAQRICSFILVIALCTCH